MSTSDFSVMDYWQGYETVARSYDELHSSISELSAAALAAKRTIAWRGQTNASWALTSKLYRELSDKNPRRKTEFELARLEKSILIKLREWGLHSQKGTGRLSILSQLAMLQHYGAPTRLIDISFNALVAAFFATEQNDKEDHQDARIFAIDITDRIINENKYLREWEDEFDTPWSESFRKQKFSTLTPDDWLEYGEAPKNSEAYGRACDYEWTTHYYAWKPPALDARIAAQNGGFLLGGVVGTALKEGVLDRSVKINRGGFQVARHPVTAESKSSNLFIEELRSLTSIAAKPQQFPKRSFRLNTRNAVYSIRVASEAKPSIQKTLKNIYGYSHSTIYPDFSGFASHWAKRD